MGPKHTFDVGSTSSDINLPVRVLTLSRLSAHDIYPSDLISTRWWAGMAGYNQKNMVHT